jgi:2-polyprenyl-3-methyl-5-hydroxy-6-metoxy-1,4-benzoquinol methylase
MTDLLLTDRGCPVCGSARRTIGGQPGHRNAIFHARAAEIADVRVARCLDCTARYINPMVEVSGDLQRELYNIDYFATADIVHDHKNMGEKRRLLGRVADEIGPLAGKSMLDIGCGTGEYLIAAAERGMRVTGVDVDASLADYIARTYGHRVITGLFDRATVPAASFDLIVLSHVIEHLPDPPALLRTIHHALKPDGVFLMCTPNFDSLLEWAHNLFGQVKHGMGRDYFLTPFTTPYHIVGFNRKSATTVLNRTGFEPVFVAVDSGLEWEGNRTSLPALGLTVLGGLLARGTALNTLSRKRV